MQHDTNIKITGLATKSEIARRMGVKPQLVAHWFKQGVPPHRIIPFCAALNWAVTPHQIDSALYPNPSDGIPDNSAPIHEESD